MASQSDRMAEFGTNVWLVDEIYQQYLADPTSVDQVWVDFFSDYDPTSASSAPAADHSAPAPDTAEAPKPKTAAPAGAKPAAPPAAPGTPL